MTAPRKRPKAKLAWCLVGPDGYLYAATCQWTRREVLQSTPLRAGFRPIRVKVTPIVRAKPRRKDK